MLPFDNYPEGGRQPFGPARGTDNCRHCYCLDVMRVTRQTSCVLCGMNLVDSYENWLMMARDHVVPTRTGLNFGIAPERFDDIMNMVIACTACNGFHNTWAIPPNEVLPATREAFFDLRDQVFAARKKEVDEACAAEEEFYNGKPWLKERRRLYKRRTTAQISSPK